MEQQMKIKAALVLMAAASSGLATDWPQYLGPNRNSTSPEKGILRSWPEGGPKVLWTVTVGRGFGGPVVKDGKVYSLDRKPEASAASPQTDERPADTYPGEAARLATCGL
jgi:hypothetical protein